MNWMDDGRRIIGSQILETAAKRASLVLT